MLVEPATQDERHYSPQRGLCSAIRTAANWATDAVLAGMVAAGLGIEALCFYLSISRTDLRDRVAVLGLPNPPERPLRRSSRTGWTPEDVRQLAELWALGVRAAVIAEVLGRSVGAIYGQRRRLGLPARARRGQTDLQTGEVAIRQANVRSAAQALGQVWPRPARPSRQLVLPFAEFRDCEAKTESRGLSEQSPAKDAGEGPKDPALTEGIRQLDDMWRVGRYESRTTAEQNELMLELALRALAQQHPRAIGAAMGMSYSAVVNRVSRLGISKFPRKLVEEFEVANAFKYMEEHNLEARTCKGLRRLFFTKKGDGSWFCSEWTKKSEALKREGREAGVRSERFSRNKDRQTTWVKRMQEERGRLAAEARKNFSDQWDLFALQLDEALDAA